MAEALTYDSLLKDIQNYAERTDEPFITQIPRLIMLAENRIASEVRGLGFIRPVNFSLAVNDPSVKKPSRWRETVSVFINTENGPYYLFPRSYEYCRAFSNEQGLPQFYADYNYEHFFFSPSPDEAYTGELIYHERPEPLTETNQTNWTTRYAPQLLLYATLLEAQPFLKRTDRMQEFAQLYERAANGIKQENGSRKTDSSMRSKK